MALLANWKHLQRKASSRIQGHWRRPDRGVSRATLEFLQTLEGPQEPPACTPGG